MRTACQVVGAAYEIGLAQLNTGLRETEIAARFLGARTAIRGRLQEPDVNHLVEAFDPARYNRNMTVAENLLFGTPRGAVFELESLRDNQLLTRVIESEGLKPARMAMGVKIAETMVELFADLPPTHEFFQQFSFISAEELPEVWADAHQLHQVVVNLVANAQHALLTVSGVRGLHVFGRKVTRSECLALASVTVQA